MGCCEWVAERKADQWRSAVEESMWRDPYISPDRAQTEQSSQMEKTMLMMRLESLQQRANMLKIKLR